MAGRRVAAGLAGADERAHLLSRVAHVNVLPVLGFADRMLVTPYLARGSLFDTLHGGGAGEAGPDAAWRVAFVAGTASGIRVMHEARIVHRDVKSANVLVSDDADAQGLPVAKLADLGVARRMRLDAEQADASTATRVIGTDGYLDPEYQDTERLTYASDVFSFGVVLLEVGPWQILLLPATSSTRI